MVWKKRVFAIATLVLLAAILSGLMVSPAWGQQPDRVKVLIGFTRQPGPAEQALVRRAGGNIKYTYHLVPAIAATLPEAAIPGLLANPNVTRIEPDGKVWAVDDELDNTWGVKRIGAGVVHGYNKGTGVKVAIIDSGIDYSHPDLEANYADGHDFVNSDPDPMDDAGHGTHVAGTVAAQDNDTGVVGVAPKAQLYALKVLGADGGGSYSDVIAALQWAVDNVMQVTNNSYGSSGDPGETVKAAFDEAYAAGVLNVCAAGNSGNPPGKGDNVIYPARYESCIAVAATGQNDGRASFSSTGPDVELAAPGVAINSTLLGGGNGEKSGTSMASPHVAGTAALVIATGITDDNDDGNVNDEVRQRLIETADDLGDPGRDPQYGFGLVDADEAAPTPATTGSIAGTVTNADDGAAISGATVSVDTGQSATTATGGTYTIANVPTGDRSVTAAADGFESQATTADVFEDQPTTVNFVLNPVDDPPMVSISSPADGSEVTSVIDITADASDDNGVTQVEFFVDGSTIGEVDTTAPYAVSWDTTTASDGSHTVTATATDDALQTASDSISVIVDNYNDPPVADAGPDQTVVDAEGDGELVTLDACEGGSIAFDAASSANTASDSNTLSWGHSTSGANRMMIVGVTTRNNVAVTSLTYGGVSLTKIRRDVLVYSGVYDVGTELWYLIAPPLGTDTVSLTTEEATTIEAGATTWTGVGQTLATALGNDAGATGGPGTTASVDVGSASEEVVVDVVGTQSALATVEAGSGQTERWNQVGTAGVGAASSKPGAANVSMSWALAVEEYWAISGVALGPGCGSYDPDGSITSYEWEEGDEVLGNAASITWDFSVGTHYVDLTVTDDKGATDSDTVVVTVIEAADNTVHIGDLDGSSTSQGRTWTANVTITVHDASERAVAGATVSGSWGNGGTASCTTDSGGQCSVSQREIPKRTGSVAFTVDSVAHNDFKYDDTANHDSDGDSDGTTITVYKP